MRKERNLYAFKKYINLCKTICVNLCLDFTLNTECKMPVLIYARERESKCQLTNAECSDVKAAYYIRISPAKESYIIDEKISLKVLITLISLGFR
jgi:hypothetical protein